MLNAAFVCIDANEGTIRRYESGGALRRTHSAAAEGPVTFTREFVEDFRRFPQPEFYVGPPNGPGPWDGGTPTAGRVAEVA